MSDITNDDVRKVLLELIDSDFYKKDKYKRLCLITALENTDELERTKELLYQMKLRSRERYLDEMMNKSETQND